MSKSMRAFALLVAGALALGCGLGAAAPALAQNTIRILVNEVPITSYDIAQRSKLNRLTGGKGGEEPALEELTDEAIQQSEAKRRGINISDAQIDAAVAQIAKQVKMTPKKLEGALGQQGIQIASLRSRIRAQMTWGRLVQAKVRASGAVGAQDIAAEILARGSAGEKRTISEFMLQQIIFVVPRGSSQGVVAQRRKEAELFRSRFPGCDGSLALAKSLRGVVVKPVGRRDFTQVGGKLGEELEKTGVGSTTSPQVTDNGVELLAVCGRQEVASDAGARAEVESELSAEQSKKIADTYMAELRAAAKIERR